MDSKLYRSAFLQSCIHKIAVSFYNYVSNLHPFTNCHKIPPRLSNLRSPTLWPSSVFVKKFITVRNWANSINSSRLTEWPERRSDTPHFGNVWGCKVWKKKWHIFYNTTMESCEFKNSMTSLQYVRWCLFLRRATLSAMLDHSVAISVEETCEPKSWESREKQSKRIWSFLSDHTVAWFSPAWRGISINFASTCENVSVVNPQILPKIQPS